MPASAPTLAQFQALQGRRFADQGFTTGAITEEAAVGKSTYHGGSVELLHRFSQGLLFRANYTLSKTMDNATNDLNTSAVNPRRPADSYNLRDEWARSALDVRPNSRSPGFTICRVRNPIIGFSELSATVGSGRVPICSKVASRSPSSRVWIPMVTATRLAIVRFSTRLASRALAPSQTPSVEIVLLVRQ